MSDAHLAALLLQAQTVADIENILGMVPAKAIPVGRDNNIGTIRMASDPGLAMIERLTNGIDSLLELAVLLNPGADPQTPQEAAALLGIPVGGLADMTDTQRRSLAEKLVISLHESGEKRRPTVRVTDQGVGQHPSMFWKTLLSLNESNKVGKPFTMGTYGQGGSVTFGFSKYTLIMSRRHPELLEDGQEDLVGWTIVYEEQTDPTKNILPRYVWIVQEDGTPFTLPAGLFPDFPHGARITHVEYDVQNLQGPFTTQMWQFLHAALFEPVLPFLVSGDRAGDPKKSDGSPDSRVIIGNAARLGNVASAKGDLELGAYDSHVIDLGGDYGSVTASWWALVRPEGSKSKSDPAGSYVDANSAVSLTLHGQRQDAERRTWIKDKAKMPFLFKNMVVHINANGLKPQGRRELFASTRERATESELRKLIYERVSDLIRSDGELKALNHSEKERLLKRSTAATNEKVRKRLGKFIKTKLAGLAKPAGGSKGSGTGPGGSGDAFSGGGSTASTGGGGGHGGGGGGGRVTDDTALPNVPTEITFDSKRMRLAQGRGSYVWVNVDAKNNYLPNHDDDLKVRVEGPSDHGVTLSSRSVLLGGKTRWAFLATPETPIGEYKLHVELTTAGGELTATLPIDVVEAPKLPSQPKGGQDEETGPDVRWVSKADGDAWSDRFGPQVVGLVDQDDESTIIWVNRDYDLLGKALASSSLTEEQINVRADRYQFPVACGLWLQHHETSRMEAPPDDHYLTGELHRLAEAVLVAMDPDVELAGSESED
ncbi:hypothetical protein RB608_18100 [Nocardioides sp. LHD-245]|uniref:hypothetical protein n=1 Tax=Nocardioides sp. LHD-245 TaxID=3051387 RepID=UPI0027DF592A|nr:hypothetical protein [Nocardioides sp. LHD-245]